MDTKDTYSVTFTINQGTTAHFTSVTVAGRKCTLKDDTESSECKCQRVCFSLKEIKQKHDKQHGQCWGGNLLC